MTKIEELRAAFEAAIPNMRWDYVICNNGQVLAKVVDEEGDTVAEIVPDATGYEADYASFITLAHNNMPALLEAVEALEKMKTSFEDLLNGYPERELHEPYQVTLNRAHSVMEKLK